MCAASRDLQSTLHAPAYISRFKILSSMNRSGSSAAWSAEAHARSLEVKSPGETSKESGGVPWELGSGSYPDRGSAGTESRQNALPTYLLRAPTARLRAPPTSYLPIPRPRSEAKKYP